ncbi:hypothetical protein Pint_25734 [Pistacia integerrima]|uniref:Uncharacterized protein n=2 Tax=Pistacia TaxID=55512 RepID=A0ACC1AZD9_9ROSI|nr:hypothetical protein Pint_25734 [Pistacia integerrima]KAJ0092010.1 hypothetical protein Patl1_26308 [Pistacia atlantica]
MEQQRSSILVASRLFFSITCTISF